MKKILFIFCFLIIFLVALFSAREKTETIGKFSWYTEQNSFEDIVQIARKANKPVFAVFSATWCGPCQRVKETVFKSDDFKKVADEVILLYIEGTTKEGAVYDKKFNVSAFPTFKMFSSQGVLLDSGNFFKHTVEVFLEWVLRVKSGSNFYELSKKLENNPNDREVLVKITSTMGLSERKEILDYLMQAIKLNPDFKDPLSHEAYENIAFYLLQCIPYNDEEEKTEYLKLYNPLFQDIVNAYYPDKFKNRMKGNYGHYVILKWFYETGAYEKVLSYFSEFLERKGDKLDLVKDITPFAVAVPTYITQGNTKEADDWIARIREFSIREKSSKENRTFVGYYSTLFTTIIKYFGMKGKLEEAEKYARIFYHEMDRLGSDRRKKSLLQHYALEYGFLAEDAVKSLTEQLKTASGFDIAILFTTRAKILVQMGKKEEARESLIAFYENKDYFKNLNESDIPLVLNHITWEMIQLKIVTQKSLEIAEKAVSLNPEPVILDTLANVHAELGNLEEAVKIEKDALKKANNDQYRKFSENIHKWQKKIKEGK